MGTAVRAGAAYFAAVFVIGFGLGTFRVLVLAPTVGETAAGLIEMPFILTASWLVCAFLIRRLDVPVDIPARAIMGGLAFGLLMVAEFGLAVSVFGASPEDHFRSYLSLNGALGLAGQGLFGLFPLLQRRR